MIYDLSPPLTPALKVWPGDLPLRREMTSDAPPGQGPVTSALHATVHLGAHADAPGHIDPQAPTIDQCDLEAYVGLCQVLRVSPPRGGLITPADLPEAVQAPRLLFATGTHPEPTVFNEDFAAFAPDLIDVLHRQGVRLVGIDTPSVDPFGSADLPVHHRLCDCGMLTLEGLHLADVPAGLYELIALPLKLVGFDASPVRAVLRPWPVS